LIKQTSSYVPGQYSISILPWVVNEGFKNISFGYLHTGATGAAGSQGPTGPQGATGSSLAISNYGDNRILTSDGTATGSNAESNLTFDGSTLTVSGTSSLSGHSILQQVSEVINSFSVTASTIEYDFSSGALWYHATASTNFTANFTNVPTIDNRAITTSLVISQGSTAYIPTAVQINGVTQSIKWAGGTAFGTANQVDIVGFTFIRSNSSWSQVLGQINTFD
jgi:hypothetical protein